MKSTIGIDFSSLEEDAKRSDDREAFKIVSGIQNCRIGVGLRLTSAGTFAFFIEVLVSLCKEHNPLDLDLLENYLLLLGQLKHRGYALNCEEDGCISCELFVKTDDVFDECKAVSAIIESCIQSRRNKNENEQRSATK